MSNVLISIKPEWVEKILKGEKTIEVRKTRPKMDTPFKVYIYCTKGKECIGIGTTISYTQEIVAEFTCDKIYEIPCDSAAHKSYCKDSCLTLDNFINYCGGETLYGWHISNLKVYDEPKQLSDFKSLQRVIDPFRDYFTELPIKRPPQSWQYVEE